MTETDPDQLHAQRVHTLLRRAILHGELESDTPLSQVKLAKRLGVSRTPLREAVRMLEREGLIVSEPNRRVKIARLSISDLEELYAHRVLLEAFTSSVSVPRLTADDFAEMRGLLDHMHELELVPDFDQWEQPHRAFHSVLRRYAGKRLAYDAAVLADHAERYRRVYLVRPLAIAAAADEHETILKACHEHDASLASRLLVNHFARTALTVIASLDPGHDPGLLRGAVQFVTNPSSQFSVGSARTARRQLGSATAGPKIDLRDDGAPSPEGAPRTWSAHATAPEGEEGG